LPIEVSLKLQEPECEIDREPELEKADGLLFGDFHLGGQD
jgi:hypothetical protein